MPSDLNLYRELSAPFPSLEALNEAITAFYAELGELRRKYRLLNVTVLVEANLIQSDGTEGSGAARCHFGNEAHQLAMIAQAYGRTKAEWDERLRWLARGG